MNNANTFMKDTKIDSDENKETVDFFSSFRCS